ncbi:MAG: anti-sigma regulatory factor [Caldisericia bacterium]|nr:anti-sigma regulatory factor [Caldisericia bacterium]
MGNVVIKTLKYSIGASSYDTVGSKAMQVKKALRDYFPSKDYMRRLGVCVFEAEANMAIHTTSGGELSIVIYTNRVKVVAVDSGPGIRDIDKALTPGFTTAPEMALQLGFGGGVGLNNIKRFADCFWLESTKCGTTLIFEVWNDDIT